MTNRELERLFKEKLNSRQFDFDPGAWSRMSEMLDADPPVKPFWSTPKLAGLAATVMVIIGVGITQFEHIGTTNHYFPGSEVSLDLAGLPTSYSSGLEEKIESAQIRNAVSATESDQASAIALGPDDEMGSPQAMSSKSFASGGPIDDAFTPANALGSSSRDEKLISLNYRYPEFNNSEAADLSSNNWHWGEGLERRQRFAPVWILAFGANISSPWEGNLEQTSNGPAYYVGFHGRQYFEKAWFVEAGLNYSARRGMNIVSTHTQITYDFGYRKTTDYAHAKLAHYFELPIMVGKGFGRHDLSVGASLNYLFAVNNSVDRVVETNVSISQSQFNSSGFKDPFRPWDLGLLLSYEYQLNPNLGLQVSGYYGLLDQTRNQLIGTEQLDRNVYLRFGLTYQPF